MTTEKTQAFSILLVITGGIAAYKSLDLIRRFKEKGARVRCILTKGGAQFVTPLAVETLSGEPVFSDLWSLTDEQQVGHIRLARDADLVLVAPATAHMLARMAHGLADDLASTVLLATRKPVFVAPAMNVSMWENPATQANVATLKARGVIFIGPEQGALACGETGAGRMSALSKILETVLGSLTASKPLAGKRALVTSGPTYEPLDPVRFIGNRSSGKQGHALAAALARAGAETLLVTGPTVLPAPDGVTVVRVETAREMLAACEKALPVDVAICAAAVADWRPKTCAETKIKKGKAEPCVELVENPDILATLAQAKKNRPRFVIGFAAETDHVQEHAEAKFKRKGCDWLVANDVGAGKVFGADDNEVTLFQKTTDGAVTATPWPKTTKDQIAEKLVAAVAEAFIQPKTKETS